MKGKKKKLTPTKGWNEAEFSKSFKYYINIVSNADMPHVYTLYAANGKAVRTLEDNATLKTKLEDYAVAKKEFIQIPAADGITIKRMAHETRGFRRIKSLPVTNHPIQWSKFSASKQ